MIKYSLLTLIIIISYSCASQKAVSETKKDENAIKYAQHINEKELKEHLYILASDEYEGRETGKKGQKMAAEYIQNEFKKDGVKPGNNGEYYQSFELYVQGPANISMMGEKFNNLIDFYYFPYFKAESMQFDWKQIEDIGDAKTLEKSKKDYTDHLLIISDVANGEKYNWKAQYKIAVKSGAKAVLILSKKFDEKVKKYEHFLTNERMSLTPFEDKEHKFPIPLFYISPKMYDDIKAMMKIYQNYEEGVETPIFDIDIEKREKKVKAENVLGFIEGTDKKDEVIVISAHYDHIGKHKGEVFNGADDDGSGTVALLEIAEAFAKAKADGNGPRRSILIMPVSGEEKGLLGSSYYTNNPVYSLDKTVCNLNIDMIGRVDSTHTGNPDYVYLIGSNMISKTLHEVSEKSNELYSQLELDYTFNKKNEPNRFYERSDHYNFAKNGIPVIFYFNGVHEDYHKATDTVDKINFSKIEKISRLIFYTAWHIANRDEGL